MDPQIKKEFSDLLDETRRNYLLYFSRLLNRVLVGPDMVQIMLTSKCNLRCRMCGVWKQQYEREMTAEEVKQIIDQSIALGVKTIYFTGGEALLRPDIFELIDYAQRPGLITTVNTNGSLIDEAMARKIVLSRLRNLTFSIDSMVPEKHDGIRGAGVFAKTMKALDHINRFKKEFKRRREDGFAEQLDVGMVSVIMKCNVAELPEIVRFAKEKQFCYVAFQPLIDNTDLLAYRDFQSDLLLGKPEIALLEKVFKELEVLRKELMPGGFHVDFMPEKTIQHFRKARTVNTCFAGFSRMFVGPSGDVSFVCFDSLRNIRDSDLGTIWRSPQAYATRKKIRRCRVNCTQFCSERPEAEKFFRIHTQFFKKLAPLYRRSRGIKQELLSFLRRDKDNVQACS